MAAEQRIGCRAFRRFRLCDRRWSRLRDTTEEPRLYGPDAKEITFIRFPFVKLDPFLLVRYPGSFEVGLLNKLVNPIVTISTCCGCGVGGVSNRRLS